MLLVRHETARRGTPRAAGASRRTDDDDRRRIPGDGPGDRTSRGLMTKAVFSVPQRFPASARHHLATIVPTGMIIAELLLVSRPPGLSRRRRDATPASERGRTP